MTDTPSANAGLIDRLREQAAIRVEFNRRTQGGGIPREPNPFYAMLLCGEAADALAAADAEIARWKQHHDDQVRKKRNLSDRYKKALADFIDKNGG
jgi:hypothetical protein